MHNQLNESALSSMDSPNSPLLTSSMDEEEIYFRSNGILTLGVEIELQLIDASTHNLCSRAEEILKKTTHIEKIKPEFYLSTIEINTDKCNTVQNAENDLFKTLSSLQLATKNMGIQFATTGSHPFSRY